MGRKYKKDDRIYTKPKLVKFVCIPCHNKIHIKEKDKEYFK